MISFISSQSRKEHENHKVSKHEVEKQKETASLASQIKIYHQFEIYTVVYVINKFLNWGLLGIIVTP